MLTDRQIALLASAFVLAREHADVVSDFEADLVREVGHRFIRFGRSAPITEAERPVLQGAVEAMIQAAEARA